MAQSLLSLVLLFSAGSQVQSATLPAVNITGGATLNVSIVIMPGLFISEASIPFDVFMHVPADQRPRTFFVAETMDPITTAYGTRIKPHYTFANAPGADILVVPSGMGSHWSYLNAWYEGTEGANGVFTGKTSKVNMATGSSQVAVTYYGNSTAMIDYVKTASASAQIVTSHCWGAFTLADAGVLDGKAVTTFPGYTDDLMKYYPAIGSVVTDQRMVVDGKVLTSNGGLAAYEAASYVVQHIYGDAVAKKVSDGLVYSPNNIGHSKLEYYKPSPAQDGALDESQTEIINVGILLTDGAFITEPVGPFDIFKHMGDKMKVFFVSEDMNPKTTHYGATMYPDYTFTGNHPAVHLLVVPSGIGSHWSFLNEWYGGTTDANGVITGMTTTGVATTYYGNSTALIKWVQDTAAIARYVTSHCWGAFTLADAGLLDGKTATTFPGYTDQLIMYYPEIKSVVTDNRIVQDGKVITSNGGVAAYEAANYAVKLIFGEEYAKKVAIGLVMAKDNYDYVNTAHVVSDPDNTPDNKTMETPATTGGSEVSYTVQACAPMLLLAIVAAIFAI